MKAFWINEYKSLMRPALVHTVHTEKKDASDAVKYSSMWNYQRTYKVTEVEEVRLDAKNS